MTRAAAAFASAAAARFCYHARRCARHQRPDTEVCTMRSLLALLLLVSVGLAAEIYPLTGEPIKGDIVSVTDKEVVFTQGGKKVTRPIKQVLKIEYRDTAKLPTDKPYSLVELTDGSQLYCAKVLLKKRDFELTLLAGPTLKLPSALVANVLLDAAKEDHRRDWKSRVFNNRGKDVVVRTRKVKGKDKDGKETEYELANDLPATIGDGDETGTALNFAVTFDGETEAANLKLSSLRGIIFKHTLGPKAATFACKLYGTTQDVVMVSSLAPTANGLAVTTPTGAKLEFQNEQIARLDYTQGRLEYLSDLTPSKMVARSNLDEDGQPDQWHVYKDSNLDKRALSLGGTTYPKGLALKPYAELVYDLKGDYREFEAVVGIDDGVSAAGASILVVEADGKELATVTVSPLDKVRHKPVKLNVKDVQKLRIVVRSDDEFDTARHLDLADAKVRKEDK
jgi:hypothetical protein